MVKTKVPEATLRKLLKDTEFTGAEQKLCLETPGSTPPPKKRDFDQI